MSRGLARPLPGHQQKFSYATVFAALELDLADKTTMTRSSQYCNSLANGLYSRILGKRKWKTGTETEKTEQNAC